MNIKISFLVLLSFTSIFINSAIAQQANYNKHITDLYVAINKHLKDDKTGLYFETTDTTVNNRPNSYLWPLCALIQATNEMEVLDSSKPYMYPVEAAIEQYKNDRPPVPAYQAVVYKEKTDTRYYDDNQWIAIAYLDAYTRTHQQKYLEKSEMICRFMLTGLDTVAGGGFYWREGDKSSKNTCSNGPGILVLLQLYKITHKPAYLTTALGVYDWVNKHLQAPEGIYYDNIQTKNLKVGKAEFTYNTGSMLQANVLLYQITKNSKYLDEARRVAKAGREHFFKNGRLPGGNYWFNAVMLRGYQALYNVDKNTAWIDFFQRDADAIWNTERDSSNMLGPKPVKSLIDQAAMIEIYARLSQIKKGNR
jgi:uncharacterized protein YyaL (SSP411 family)